MAKGKTGGFEVPDNLRDFTQQSVEQAQKAFDDFLAAAQAAVGRIESSSSDAQSGALELNRKIIELAEENVASAFAHAQRMVKARDLQEMVKLQSEFVKTQMSALGEQARVLSDAASNVVIDRGEKG